MTLHAEEMHEHTRDIEDWFALTYSGYMVLPRVQLVAMPDEWQRRFVALLDEMQRTMEDERIYCHGSYMVQARDEHGRFTSDGLPHYRHAPRDFDLLRRAIRPPQ